MTDYRNKISKFAVLLGLVLSFVPTSIWAHDEFVELIANNKPAVVTLKATAKLGIFKSKEERERERLLKEYAESLGDELEDVPRVRYGTGFIISSDGLLLTVAHIVRGTSSISVEFADGSSATAKLLHYDDRVDLAVLQVNKTSLPSVQMGSDLPLEGQSVLAMGSSMQLPVSSATGIVSGLAVDLPGRGDTNLIQTDVAINPGASGGPLFNSSGEVIGMMSQIYTTTGSFSGTSFAVPSSEIQRLLNKWKVDLNAE